MNIQKDQNGPDSPCPPGERTPISAPKLAVGAALILALAVAYWQLSDHGWISLLTDEARLRREVAELGSWGVVAVVALMTFAIVMSPIPSGPIAMVAGAVYGPLWGAIYTIIGSVMGATIAFGLARCLGYDFVCRWLKGRLTFITHKRSQNRLMGIVFVSRLVPFISFDAVSYAAGLTPLSFWRFAIATFAGVIPISFLLTFFGERLLVAESGWTTAVLAVIACMTVLPFGVKWLRDRYKARKKAEA